jgi:hypothetical protein
VSCGLLASLTAGIISQFGVLKRRESFRGPFKPGRRTSRSYVVGLGRSGPARAIFDTSGDFDNDQRSDLRLWINGEPWGPPHAPHELILERGTRALVVSRIFRSAPGDRQRVVGASPIR